MDGRPSGVVYAPGRLPPKHAKRFELPLISYAADCTELLQEM